MARVHINDPTARFCVTVWEEKSVAFTTREEAMAEYQRLKKNENHTAGEVAEWVGLPDSWKELEAYDAYEDAE
ncbi:MAG: hypothetical protein QOG72_2498 [Sphingomonadales bacterium]|jgi:hypothetical protein|nr:hypothetical protein [Sphingomonadales bacterium]